MAWYPILKQLHVTAVLLSLLGFLLRGWWMWCQSPLLDRPLTRVLPHVVDTALLASAIALAWLGGQYPFVQPWLTAKVLALLLYIVLGSIALKRGRSRPVRVVALLGALLVFAYIVGAALSRSVWSWLAI